MDAAAFTVADFILVQDPAAETGNEQFPYAASSSRAHRMYPTVPAIEIPHHADPLGVRGPDHETHAIDTIGVVAVRAQHPVTVPVTALAEQVEVEIAHLRREGIGIMAQCFTAILVAPAQAVAFRHLAGIGQDLEEIRASRRAGPVRCPPAAPIRRRAERRAPAPAPPRGGAPGPRRGHGGGPRPGAGVRLAGAVRSGVQEFSRSSQPEAMKLEFPRMSMSRFTAAIQMVP
jgi:hypothetical protein